MTPCFSTQQHNRYGTFEPCAIIKFYIVCARARALQEARCVCVGRALETPPAGSPPWSLTTGPRQPALRLEALPPGNHLEPYTGLLARPQYCVILRSIDSSSTNICKTDVALLSLKN